jgi:hypothetical protein
MLYSFLESSLSDFTIARNSFISAISASELVVILRRSAEIAPRLRKKILEYCGSFAASELKFYDKHCAGLFLGAYLP